MEIPLRGPLEKWWAELWAGVCSLSGCVQKQGAALLCVPLSAADVVESSWLPGVGYIPLLPASKTVKGKCNAW